MAVTMTGAGGVRIEFADQELTRFSNMLGALGEGQARTAMARAVNRVTTSVRSRVIREIAKNTSIPRKQLNRLVTKRLASPKGKGPIFGIVAGSGKDIGLKWFGAKQFSWGVRAKIDGEWRRFPHMFIFAGKWNSGKVVGGGQVFLRDGSASTPITKQNGPPISAQMLSSTILSVYETTAREMLPARVMHEISRLLEA